jgi:hypothetical protein
MSDAWLFGQFLYPGSFDAWTLLNSPRCEEFHVPLPSTERPDRVTSACLFGDSAPARSVSLEVLHCPLVLLGLLESGKGSQIAALASLSAFLSRIQTKLSGFEFANHTRGDAFPQQ